MNMLRIMVAIGLFLTGWGCGDDGSSRGVSSGTYSIGNPGEARNDRLEAVLGASGIPVDPCLGKSSDGICFGLATPDCEAAHVIAGECIAQCNGTCVDGLSTQLPTCQCDAGFPSPCEALKAGGECRGDIYLRCREGILEGINCPLTSESKCIETDDGAGCGEVGTANTCGVLVHGDVCEGNKWVRCDEGAVVKVDCSETDLLCGFDPVEGVLGCIEE